MASKKDKTSLSIPRVWIELEYPKTDPDVEGPKRAKLMSAMLRRLGIANAMDGEQDVFFWSPKESRYCIWVGGGFYVCQDHGHWFNLPFLAGVKEEDYVG